ncbi:MAG: shikimate kinase [Bacteroidota bacterium]
MQSSIYLVGFMGSGKSHVGRQLSRYLRLPFVDLDAEIVAHYGGSINTIFSAKGEAYFRLLERFVLHQTELRPPAIIATGGGTPCFFDNIHWMNKRGTCIFLDPSIEILTERLRQGRHKRPLIKQLSDHQLQLYISNKLSERRPFYEQAAAHFRINKAEEDVAGMLYRQLNYIIGH